jgi:hypothetical protein
MPLEVTKEGRRSGLRSTAFFQAPSRQRASGDAAGRAAAFRAGAFAAGDAFLRLAFAGAAGRRAGFAAFRAGDFAFDTAFAFFLAMRGSSRVLGRGGRLPAPSGRGSGTAAGQ